MSLPGFHVYRQDCNMHTQPFWRRRAPDRQGITEMKYIAGLYEFGMRCGKSIPTRSSRSAPARPTDRPGDRNALPHAPGLGVLRPEHGQPGVADGHRAVSAQRRGDDAAVPPGRLFLPFGIALLAVPGLERRGPQVRHEAGARAGRALSAGPAPAEQGLVLRDAVQPRASGVAGDPVPHARDQQGMILVFRREAAPSRAPRVPSRPDGAGRI